jgi:glutathione S-transferase
MCPYAMRARLGLLLAEQTVLLRDIVLKDKPDEMMQVSPDGTVPLLILNDGTVINESLEIMLWALEQNDPHQLLGENRQAMPAIMDLVNRFDADFVHWHEQYKRACRRHDMATVFYRRKCEAFLAELERRLASHPFILGQSATLADYAMMPLIRQFSRIDRPWYRQAPYPKLRQWLDKHLQSQLFSKAVAQYERWLPERKDVLFTSS